jgi:hypothetical protein
MKIAFISEKGGASKTTYTRIVAEYFKSDIQFKVDNNLYSDAEKDVINNLGFEYAKPVIYNVTNSEKSITRFRSFITIKEVECVNSDLFFSDLNEAIKSRNLSLFDFGADIYKELMSFEESEIGKQFFSEINIMFVPIKYDQESIEAAQNIIHRFQVYSNIKFVFCLTEYIDNVEIDFSSFYENKVLISMINFLSRQDRGRIITVPFSRLIRDSDKQNLTFAEYIKTVENEQTSLEYETFMDDTFSKFDYIFLGLNRDPELATHVPHSKIENTDIAAILEAINSLSKKEIPTQHNDVHFDQDLIDDMSENIVERINEKIDSVKAELNSESESESIKKFLKSFEPIDINMIADEVRTKFTNNTKKLLVVLLFGAVFAPAFVFSLVGYYYGIGMKKEQIIVDAQAEVGYANNLSKELVEKGAAHALTFGKLPGTDTITIACTEENNHCTTRYDYPTKKGIIEIKK